MGMNLLPTYGEVFLPGVDSGILGTYPGPPPKSFDFSFQYLAQCVINGWKALVLRNPEHCFFCAMLFNRVVGRSVILETSEILKNRLFMAQGRVTFKYFSKINM